MLFSKIETSDEKLGGLLLAQTLLVLASSPAIPKLPPNPGASTAVSHLAAMSLLIHLSSKGNGAAHPTGAGQGSTKINSRFLQDPVSERKKKQGLSGHS